jgi:ABC-2 type transport system permease protein
MTTTAVRPTIPHVGVPGLRLVRSEIRKIATTNAWWLFGIASLVITGLFLWANLAQAAQAIATARSPIPETPKFGPPPGADRGDNADIQNQIAQSHDLHLQAIRAAGNVFTSGQFFGLVLVMLLGVLVITNEFQYQTATATFLTTPHRTRVVFGKLFAAIGLGFLFWLVSFAVSLTAGLIFFHNINLTNSLGEWAVQRAILFNLLAYLLWAVFGFGLGTLLRSQIGSTITAMAIYLVGYAGGILAFTLIRMFVIHRDGVLTAAVALPPIASQIMISPEKLYEQSAPWWVGALVMIGWGVLAGTGGILLTRRRDIS